MTFHIEHVGIILKLLASFLAYGSFDVSRFIGANTSERVDFFGDYIWAAPFTVFVAVVGVLQALFLLYRFIMVHKSVGMNKKITYFTLLSFLLFYFSSFFSSVAPPSHAAVLFFPVIAIYSLYAYRELLTKIWVQRTARMVFLSAVIMYCAIGWKNYQTISIYQDRGRVERALDQKEYKIVGQRRYD